MPIDLLVVPLAVRGGLDAIGMDAMGSPWWLPEFGTVGRTVATYGLLVSLMAYLVTSLLPFAPGYRFYRSGRDRASGTTR